MLRFPRPGPRRAPALFAVLAVLAAACATAASDGPAPAAGASPGAVDARGGYAVRYLAGLDLSGGAGVSGLSGLIAPAPDRLTAVSDFGGIWRARLVLDPAGVLTGVTETGSDRLGGPAWQSGKADADAEAIARLPDGRTAVAFERRHRLQVYPSGPGGPTAAPAVRDLPGALDALPGNAGVEALAALPDGRVLAIAEAKSEPDLTHLAFLGSPDGGRWTTLRYRAARGFAPSDAAALPSGDVLVLERWYLPLLGFRARLAVIPAEALAGAGPAGGATLEGRRVADLTPPIGRDNLEGLAVVPDDAGTGATLYLVSDDNRAPNQRALLLQYRLTRGTETAERP